MQFTDCFKRRFSLTEKTDIGKENISVLDLRLGTLIVNLCAVSPFDQVALSKRASNKRKTAWSNKPFIRYFNNDLLHSAHLSSMVLIVPNGMRNE